MEMSAPYNTDTATSLSATIAGDAAYIHYDNWSEILSDGTLRPMDLNEQMEVAVTDMWSDDPNAVDPNKLQIIKDGTSEFDILTKAYVQIDYYGPETDMMAPSSEWYEEASDLEPIVAGGYTWKGFSAVSGGNPMTVLYTGEAGGPQFQATLWSNGGSTISAADADVLAILESVKPAA